MADNNNKDITHLRELDTSDSEDDDFLAASVDDQVDFMREYLTDFPGEARDLFSNFDNKYRCSGVSTLARVLERVCLSEGFTGDIKLISAQALLSFTEELEEENDLEPNNRGVIERNKKRITRGVFCLQHIIDELIQDLGRNENIASIVVFDAISLLLKLADDEKTREALRDKCESFMKKLISNKYLDPQYRLKLSTRITDPALLNECVLFFLGDPGNPTSMRILAAQKLLDNQDDDQSKDVILAQIEIFARDEELDMYIRADAADTMLGYGSEEVQIEAREIIRSLGTRQGFGIYNNAQNVHADAVEESVRGSLNTLKRWSISNPDKVKSFESTLDDFTARRTSSPRTVEEIRDAETAILRIELGNRKYVGFTSKSLFCAICAWIAGRSEEERAALWCRFDQELEDMVNTCSTGVISRLVNVLSGWDGFQIQISFKDQIKSNFTGRLNAVARSLVNASVSGEHPFYVERKNDLANIYISDVINKSEQTEEIDIDALRSAMADRGLEDTEAKEVKSVVVKMQSRESRIADHEKKTPLLHALAREHFADQLFTEFCSSEKNRKCFHLFLGFTFTKVTQELRDEFSKYVEADEFEVCVRDALAFYEGN